MNNLTINQLKVKREHLIFDLEKFMKNNGLSDGAVLLITPNQFVMTDCFVKMYKDDNFGSHFDAISVIYDSIYGKSKNLNEVNAFMWANMVMNDGNICLQLCACDEFSISLVCIPDTITKEQYNLLVAFNEAIKSIYQNNKNYFDKYPMGFVSSSSNFDCDSINNIDSILLDVKDRIGEVKSYNEFIIGDTLKDINLYKRFVKKR